MVLMLLLAVGGAAHASAHHERWDALKKLAVGTPVLVQSGTQLRPELCELEKVEDGFLTCDRVRDPEANWTPASGARLMFPRGGVKNVWVWEEDHRPSVATWIGIVLSVGLEIGACVSSGGAGCAAMALLIGIGWVTAESDPAWYMPPRPPKMRRRLVYRAPAVAAGTP
jgi:hypothetical protein